MLEELHVRDLALIDEVELEFGTGLTVLTGETGAGKTVLVGALQLLLGERADATHVRGGAPEALVEGRFGVDGQELLVRRRVSAEGRSKCAIDGSMVSVRELTDRLGPLVDLHGQHDHQALLAPSRHASYLDRAIGDEADMALARYRAAFAALADARAVRDRLAAELSERERVLDYLRFQCSEIDTVAPRQGEDAALQTLLPRLRHGDRLLSATVAAHELLSRDDGGTDLVAAARIALRGVEGIDGVVDEVAARIDEALLALDDAVGTLRDYGEQLDFDPRALDATESRLAALGTLMRTYGPTLDDVLETRAAAGVKIDQLEAGERGLAEAEDAVIEASDDLQAAADHLTGVRRAAAPDFAERLHEAAADLAMESARFGIAIEQFDFESFTAEGPHRLEFLYAPGAGEPLRPIARIASGGELSRVMLALKGVLGDADTVPTLVFDEVDVGIGGATATAVGRRLAQLAQGRQVLVITHLAQVAAFAHHHIVVRKDERDGRSVTSVGEITGEDRVTEIARMLSGGVSETSRAHARELIERPDRAVL